MSEEEKDLINLKISISPEKYIEPLITDRDDSQCYPISWYSKDVLLQILKEVE